MKQYKLFIDLDGVLADFEKGVLEATGKEIGELSPKRMWPILAKTPGFYAKLKWMADGKELWDYVKDYNPTILTGLPLGQWAESQKRQWCNRELGKDVPVICCMTRNKASAAMEITSGDEIPLLVDDRLKTKEPWEDMGGIFIFHRNSSSSIEELRNLL